MRTGAIALIALLAAASPLAAETSDTPANSAGAALDRGANISVAPLRLELGGAQTAETLRLRNPAARKIGVQVRVFAWDQVDGEDVYTPTTDVSISPAIIQIKPGDTQIFRVVRTTQAGESEKRYRVAIDQLPDPSLNRHGEFTPRLRFTLPLFVDRQTAQPAQLAWQVAGDKLLLDNAGGQTVRIAAVAMNDASGEALPLNRSGLRYVMGSKKAEWTIRSGCPSGPIEIAALVDGEETRVQAQPNCG
ncbi:molecular chaperone [Croceicoccus sediminis]|uniref:fimbrial biogenesis chaperone n=1 Tax=Croceicoccus sediminis TaxID=2571150 RepID=UPI001182B94C|nr:fimbria/pilus periplasmic chaperone [Croceicoccus sediminis]